MRRTKHQRGRSSRETAQPAAQPVFAPSTARILLASGVDINTNIGEGFGPYRVEGETEVLPFVTSANVACGAHSGDPVLMEAALESVRYYGLSLN
jgi:hypothetical protein